MVGHQAPVRQIIALPIGPVRRSAIVLRAGTPIVHHIPDLRIVGKDIIITPITDIIITHTDPMYTDRHGIQ